MLDIKDLSKEFLVDNRKHLAIDGISVSVKKHQFVTIVGSNGAGKSTLLNTIAGVFPATIGEISLDGTPLQGLAQHKRAKMISRVFQDPLMGTAGDLTIGENLLLAELRGKSKRLRRGVNKSRIEFYKESLNVLGLGLENRLDAKVKELSGGQRQALALILATITSPKLLLLDEHTAALDPKTAALIMELTVKVVEEQGLTALMVTHNIQYALETGNRTWMMHSGKIIEDFYGKEREQLTVDKLIQKFTENRHEAMLSDRTLLAG